MIELRPYRDSDRSTVWDLHVRGLQAFGAFVEDPSLDADLLDIQQAYFSSGGNFLVAELSGRLVGMGAYRIYERGTSDKDTVEIKRMRVVPELQGQGIGQRILDALEESAISKGFRRFVLDTSDKQPLAQKFYKKNGYTETERKVEKSLIRIYYEKKISSD